jgi:hypothetical protein
MFFHSHLLDCRLYLSIKSAIVVESYVPKAKRLAVQQ